MALPRPAVWPGDDTWGPRLPGQRDLTLAFENVALAIVPAALMLLLAPVCIRRVFRDYGPGTVVWTMYLEISLVSASCATDLIGADIWATAPHVPPYATEAAVMTCLATLAVGVVLFVSRVRGHQPRLPSVYAAATALFDIVRMRSFLLRGMRSIATVCLMTALLKVLLVTLGQISWRLQDRRALLRGRSFFAWTIATLSLGFRMKIHLHDLPELDPQSKADAISATFQAHWTQANKNSPSPLLQACFDTLRWELANLLPYRLAFFGFAFSQPFLIQHVTSLVQHGQPPPDVIARVTVMTALVFLGIGVCKGYYRDVCLRVSALLRGILVSAIFEKSMQLDCDVLSKKEAFKLMDTDLTAIEETPARVCDLGISLLEVGFGTCLLYKYVGLWCCLVFIPSSFVAFMSAKMAYSKAAAREAWNAKIEHRVSVASNAMSQLKGMKSIGLSSIVSTQIQELHAEEVETSSYDGKLRVVTHAIDILAESMTPTLVLIGSVSWLAVSTSHSACEVFTIMVLVYLVSYAMVTILNETSRLAVPAACFKRIERFLLREPVKGLSNDHLDKSDKATEIGRIYSTWRSCTPELKNATLLHPASSTPILRNASVRFAPGGVTMFHGPVGCGRSSLLRVLLGEKRLDEGIVTMPPGPAGYCDETPWLVENEIRANILGQHEYVEEWYERILEACLISEELPGKKEQEHYDLDLGQKQRVQLARAVYGKPNLVVLDDPCRNIDDDTAMAILDRLFGPGGAMRLLGITIIIATNNPLHLAVADVVYTLDGEGHVDTLERPVRTSSASKPPDWNPSHTREMYEPTVHADTPKAKDPSPDNENDSWFYWFLADSAGWGNTLLSLLLLALTAMSLRFPPVYMRVWLSTEPENRYCFVGYTIVTMFPPLLTVASMAAFYLQFAPTLSRNLHQTLVKTVFGPRLARLPKTDTAELVGFFAQDMMLLSRDLPRALLEVAHLAALVGCDLLVLLSCNSYILIIAAMFPATAFGLQHHYLVLREQVQALADEAAAPLRAHFDFAAQGVIHIRAMRWQPVLLKDCQRLLAASLRPHYAVSCPQRWLHLLIDVFVALTAVICVGSSLCLADEMSETAIGLTMLILVSFGSTMCRLFDGWASLQPSLAALNRLRRLAETAKAPSKSRPSADDRFKPNYDKWKATAGRLDVYAVTAGFNGFRADNNAVQGLTLQIPSGSKLAIVGPPGSGKSALLLCVLTVLDYSGNIYIDGINVQGIPPDVLRTNVIVLPQGGIELPGSIRRNLDPWATPEHAFSDAEIYAVLQRVGMAELVRSQGGLSTAFAAARLSKGEKQLLFLARAILRKEHVNSHLILVDDVTRGIDDETADRIQQVIETTFADCTVVTVTSRMETLRIMQRIVEMDKGRLVNTIDRPRPGQQESGDLYDYVDF